MSLEAQRKQHFKLSKVEMLYLPWQLLKRGMESLREMGRLELIYHLYTGEDPSDDPQEGSEDESFTVRIRNALVFFVSLFVF